MIKAKEKRPTCYLKISIGRSPNHVGFFAVFHLAVSSGQSCPMHIARIRFNDILDGNCLLNGPSNQKKRREAGKGVPTDQ